jgi:hypothetical protein
VGEVLAQQHEKTNAMPHEFHSQGFFAETGTLSFPIGKPFDERISTTSISWCLCACLFLFSKESLFAI